MGASDAWGGRGAVYRFSRDQGGSDNWGQVERFGASDGADDDCLGCSVSASGSLVLAGAYHESGAGTLRGAAYLFTWP